MIIDNNLNIKFFKLKDIKYGLKKDILNFYNKTPPMGYIGKIIINNKRKFLNDDFRIGVAYIDNKICGVSTIAVKNNEALTGFIREPKLKGFGIGNSLLLETKKYLSNQNINVIFATTTDNTALYFFHKQGFVYHGYSDFSNKFLNKVVNVFQGHKSNIKKIDCLRLNL